MLWGKTEIDLPLFFTIIGLLVSGVLMVASASFAVAEKKFGMPFHFLYHHLFYVGIGCLFAFFVTQCHMDVWQRAAPFLFIASVLSLIVVLIPGLGVHMNGSVRWLRLGPLTLQASELMKLSSIFYFSDFLSRQRMHVRYSAQGFITVIFFLCMIGALLLLEPDFGAMMVITCITFALLLLAGVNWRYLAYLFSFGALAMVVLAISSPYRMLRLTAFLNPWQARYGSGYQLTQALIAFGRGKITGLGLGHSVQKHFYLPEAHTDFIFAVLAEEGGLLACLALLSLFLFLVLRGCAIGRALIRQQQLFSGYVTYGISLWLGLQALINIGVNIGLLPTKGLTLPLVSYGGTSIVLTCVACGLLLRAHHEMMAHPLKKGWLEKTV